MTGRERLAAVLTGGRPDMLPWAPLMDDYFFAGLPGHEKEESRVAFCRKNGCDYLRRHAGVTRLGWEAPISERKKDLGGGMEETILDTPWGSLREVVQRHDGTSRWVEHFIKDASDMRLYARALSHRVCRADCEEFHRIDEAIGETGLPVASCPPSPLVRLHEELLGLENTVYALADEPDETEALMRAIGEADKEAVALAADSPSLAVFSYEDTSTTTISDTWYRDYCRTWLDEYHDLCAARGKPFFVHMCGKLKGFRELIRMSRAEGFDSVCPPQSGDVELWEAAEYWPGRVLIGGVEPALLAMADGERLKETILNLLTRIRGLDRLILCTGDAVANGTPEENIRLVSRLLGREVY